VVPETTSFKVLYTGLLKENLWVTSIVVVAPVALIIFLFILFFDPSTFVRRSLGRVGSSTPSTLQQTSSRYVFLFIYLTLFIYYIIATIFYGHYQERYRLPLMVVFIIPVLSYFLATFNKGEFLKKTSLIFKGVVIVLFLAVWIFQTKKAIGNKQRFENAIESIEAQSMK
jgi:hypothetical protein